MDGIPDVEPVMRCREIGKLQEWIENQRGKRDDEEKFRRAQKEIDRKRLVEERGERYRKLFKKDKFIH